ncbi:MAG TPA: CPBP family glutamic-type intramembrane protease [bacterium]|nr:CPBP family glutamic-type intramembrane protease [bacterium]
MKKISLSIKVYLWLIILLALLAAINVFLPQGTFIIQEQQLPASKPVIALVNAAIMFFVYGGLGLAGIKFSKKLDFPDLMDAKISNRQRFMAPALIGIGIGVFFIIVDVFISQFHSLGQLPHPPFPTSLVASAVAGIGEEVIFRLFFITFWTWLVSYVILHKKGQNIVFWIVTIISALAFAVSHLPAIIVLYGFENFSQIPILLLFEIVLLNSFLSIFAADYFRKYGFLAAVGIHFWVDIVWHVIWGAIK